MSSDLEQEAKTAREIMEYLQDVEVKTPNIFASEIEDAYDEKWVRLETAQDIIQTELNSVTELYNFAREQLSGMIDNLEKKLAKQSAQEEEQKKRFKTIIDRIISSYEKALLETVYQEVFGENVSEAKQK